MQNLDKNVSETQLKLSSDAKKRKKHELCHFYFYILLIFLFYIFYLNTFNQFKMSFKLGLF